MANNERNVVIVESPTKAKTIKRFLPKNTIVIASMGHIRDLPPSSFGVDIANDFNPTYVVSTNKKKIVSEIKQEAKKATNIYLASDPDREGEAIAWHLYEILRPIFKGKFHRISFHEITQQAIMSSFENPEEIDLPRVNSQQARRILDRIVGFQVSPLVSRKLHQSASAGRVQSVALRIVVERERAIEAFKPVEYWNLEADFDALGAQFPAKLHRLDNVEPVVGNAEMANELANELEAPTTTYKIVNNLKKASQQRAKPPFTTSTLQQAASSNLHMGTSQTMRVAQELYEGIDLGSESVGLITYMRTDSVNLAHEATNACREFINENFGNEYLPSKTNIYASGKNAQEAHEAIRPTNVNNSPEKIKQYLSPQQYKLYKLIWNRFVACQMAPAKLLTHNIDVAAEGNLKHSYLFHAVSTEVTFLGYRKVYDLTDTETNENKDTRKKLPNLPEGTGCSLKELKKEQKFTEPPSRFSEATLVKTLEENGIGRPSTYASTISTIINHGYVEKDKSRLLPTKFGFSVNDYLVDLMPELFQVKFTASMENSLDEVEKGNVAWTDMLKEFYNNYKQWLGANQGSSTVAPDSETALAIFDLIPENIKWNAPIQGARRIYDDNKSITSLKKQITEKNKSLSDKQFGMLLNILAKYTSQIPNLVEELSKLNITLPEVTTENGSNEEVVIDERLVKITELFDKSIVWNEPTKRGKRVYDDKKFFTSLKQQISGGKKLSELQIGALLRLASNYVANKPNYAEIIAPFATAPAVEVSPEEKAKAEQANKELASMMVKFDNIKEWETPAPAKKGSKRSFNDKDFADSLCQQFKAKGTLSEKQIAAAQKILVKYKQIEAPAKVEPKMLEEKCPQCEAQLVERFARGKKFYSCSNFPKCRFAINSLEDLNK